MMSVIWSYLFTQSEYQNFEKALRTFKGGFSSIIIFFYSQNGTKWMKLGKHIRQLFPGILVLKSSG